MQISSGCQLTYCSNIHPGEDWPTLFANLRENLPAVKLHCSPEQPMGVGLRLSARAAEHLASDCSALTEFQQWLQAQQLYVFTLNGFPYGTFHGDAVKEKVYRPDWSNPHRYHYTCQLAELLAELLPTGLHGSISTVPVGFTPDISQQDKLAESVALLLDCIAYLIELRERTGVTVQLALEPEPGCYLETSAGTIEFFSQHIFCERALQRVSHKLGRQETLQMETLKNHIGVCLDTCHAAVMFESSRGFAEKMIAAEIPIHKIQLTTALQISPVTAPALDELRAYSEGVYLHQTCVRERDDIRFYLDLPKVLEDVSSADELRSHFHVPVFFESLQTLGTTQSDLIELLDAQRELLFSPHLEVETYTFDVLPKTLNCHSVVENIAREIHWVQERLT